MRAIEGNPKNLAETGWGVIFAPDISGIVRKELSALLAYRRDQATSEGKLDYYQEFLYHPGETARDFLRRNGVRPDAAADPDRGVPYYLLLVGDPKSLPYRFQQELGVNYSVGRIHFENPQDYRRYAQSVISTATEPRLARQVTFFGVTNENDPATLQRTSELILPLAKDLLQPMVDWKINTLIGSETKKARLARVLGGDETPALLFLASHGVGFPPDDERQLAHQGGLVCQDWPGPDSEVGVLQEHYFTAEDLSDDANVKGLIAFLSADYSAGTQERESFPLKEDLEESSLIAPRPFVSRLCQRLLSHPKGGALAVVGHIGLTSNRSFTGSSKGEGADDYRYCLRRLLDRHTLGWAVGALKYAHLTLATELNLLLEDRESLGKDPDPKDLADLWLAVNDLRSLVIVGDPAVKLSVAP